MSEEYTVPTTGAEEEENNTKDLDQKPSAAEPIINKPSGVDDGHSNNSDKTSSSAVNMAGMVQANSREFNSDDDDDDNSADRQSKPSSQQSLMSSNSIASHTSVWESDLNDDEEEETSYGDDDDDFYGLNGQQQQGTVVPAAAAAGGYPTLQEYNNPHIQQTYPIPSDHHHHQQQQPPNDAAVAAPNLKPSAPSFSSSAASNASAESKASRASSRRSRRGSLRVPGDEGGSSASSMRESAEERREREFKERLNKLERQSSRNRRSQQQQQPKPREPCRCTKDAIPVAGSLLLLAVGIAVAIFLLFGNSEEEAAATTAPPAAAAPTPSPTLPSTIDPNPFRRTRRNLESWKQRHHHRGGGARRPTEKACRAVQNGRPILGQDLMASIKVDATMDITTYEDMIEPNSILRMELLNDSERRIIPTLAGCLDKEEEAFAKLRKRRTQRIQEDTARYTIANGKVTNIAVEPASSCYEIPEMHGPCYRVVLGFEFWHHRRLDNDFSMDTLVDELFNDRMTERMSSGDIISQAQVISVVER